MLTEREIQETSQRRARALMLGAGSGVAAVLFFLIAVSLFRDRFVLYVTDRFGERVAGFAPIVLMLSGFAVLLAPLAIADRAARRLPTICPQCGANLARSIRRLLATRCCPACERRVVQGGRVRSQVAFTRLSDLRSRAILRRWLWVWPILGGAIVGWWYLDRAAFEDCPNALWLSSLIGAATAGWAWLRTRDCRCIPQFFASFVLFVLGATAFWRTM